MSALLDFNEAAFDLSVNADAPLAHWAPEIQARGYYEDRGEGPEAFDCMGIVHFVQKLVGRAVRDYRSISADIDVRDPDAVAKIMAAESVAWERAFGAPGDVLALGSARRAHHVAVLCGGGRALHARPGAGVCIDEIGSRRRARRFAGLRIYGVLRPS